jgi:uncharacterized protein YndB with AHSA1/START domain
MTDTRAFQVTTPTEREIAVTRIFDAPRQAVFDALTRPELLKRWMFGPDAWSLPVCESDLRAGGALRFLWRGPGMDMGMSGVYREVAPPGRLVHTEVFDEDWTGGETVVTTLLTEQGGRTTLTTTILYTSREARDAVLKTPMAEGMATSYDRLAALIAG